MGRTSVLITEDESIIAMDLKHTLESLGYRVCHVAATGVDAVAAADDHKPEIILMDIFLDGPMDGVEAAIEIQRRHKLPVVYLTAHSDEATFIRARETRPHGFILKPCGADTLYSTIETALERHRLEQLLRESEELLNETGEMARVGGWKIDLLTNRVRWTRAVHLIFEVPEGYEATVDEAIGFYAPHHRSVVSEALQRAEKDGIPFDLELDVITAKGNPLSVRVTGYPVLKDGACTGISGTFQDITEKRMTEKALRESEERYRTIVEQSLVGIGISRGDEILYANHSLLKMLGYDSLEEFSAIPLLDHLTPESRLLAKNRMAALAKGEIVPPVFHRDIMRKDGAIRTVELAVSPVIFNGEPCRQSTFIDITARIQADEALKEKNRHFFQINQLLQELPDTASSMEVVELLCERLKEITGAVMVLFNEYDAGRKEVFTRHIAAGPGVMDFVATFYPDGPASIRFPVDEKWKRHMLLQQYAKLEGGLHEASFGLMSPEDARNIEHALGVKGVYALALSWEGELLGGVIVLTPHGEETLPFKIMESYARAATSTFSRQKAVEKLRETEELFRSLAENSQDYIMRYDRQCRHTYMNPAGLKVGGHTEKDIIGKTHREAGFPDELCDLWEKKINRVFETGKPLQHRFEWESVKGPVVLDWRLFPEFDSG
ncbi:MAG TPA: PAS domain S-box protein, partial [Spirochaetes bacterium]|nr:PAS domain S-box protein [Spirochaetota bacterium]